MVNSKTYVGQPTITTGSGCDYQVGQSLIINYNPDNPHKWATDPQAIKNVLKFFPIVGGLVFLVSLVTFAIRLLSIIFGWKILRSGRALAKTLPPGTNLETAIGEIKKEFSHSLFPNSGGNAATMAGNFVQEIVEHGESNRPGPVPPTMSPPTTPTIPPAVPPATPPTVTPPVPPAAPQA
jgi:hypothetical protein